MLDLLVCFALALGIIIGCSLIMLVPVIFIFNKLVWINDAAELPKAIIHSEKANWLSKRLTTYFVGAETTKPCQKCGAMLYPSNKYDCMKCDTVYVLIDNMVWEMSERLANESFLEYPRVKGPKGN